MLENSFKNPLVPLIDNPVNIDRPIQELQQALAALGWLEKVFGRSWLAVKSSEGYYADKKLYYPQVWQGVDDDGKVRDHLEVMPNDNIKSQAFFKVNDPTRIVEFVRNGDSILRTPVDIIFWFNLQRIDRTIDYNFTELLKSQVLRVLEDVLISPDSDVNVLAIHEQPLNVWRGYNIQEVKDQELIYPWGGFRVETEITYREDCPRVQLPPV